MRRRTTFIFFLIILFCSIRTHAQELSNIKPSWKDEKEVKMNTQHFYELSNESFFKIDLGSGEIIENEDLATNKVIANNLQGIIIDGPVEISLNQHDTIPLIGLARLPANEIGTMRESLVVVITDNITKKTYSKSIYKAKRSLPDPEKLTDEDRKLQGTTDSADDDKEDLDPDSINQPEYEASLSMRFFDADLRALARLPENITNYSVFVTLGSQSSNVIVIKVIK